MRDRSTRVDGYAPIGDYAAIGDGRTLALVASDGAIDWLPLPTISRGATFGALLDAEHGGSFRLEIEGGRAVDRRYVEGTNVLETTFASDSGTAVVTDALTLQDGGLLPWIEVARRVRCTAGSVAVRWEIQPRFDYGLEEARVQEIGGTPVALGKRLRLAAFSFDLGKPEWSAETVAGSAELHEGADGLLVCVATDNEPVPYPPRRGVEIRLSATCDSWRRWIGGATYEGRWNDAVRRSALALKLLIYAPSGAMTAAGTTALPERIGGSRNWDYRFAWIRDSAFALDALSRLGYREQVHASLSWLLDVTDATHPRLPPLFDLDGHVPRHMRTLPLRGYRGSEPVQRGNKASTQLQLGNFGYLFETVERYVAHGNALDPVTGTRLAEAADFLCRIWRNDDSGIWELGQHRQYTSSKLQCWVALTHAAKLASRGQLPSGHVDLWLSTAEQVRDFVERRCFSASKGSYTFYAGTEQLDCAVLLGLQHGFTDVMGERMNGTIDALRRELAGGGPLVYRYSGMEGEEGCFLACSFWLVIALAKAGRLDEARTMMDELVALGNEVGLYAEQMDASTHEQLGNFPQALTHLSLIRAAFAVQDAENREEASD